MKRKKKSYEWFCNPAQLSKLVEVRDPGSEKKSLLTTLTGEIFQPLRLYYEILNPSALKMIFGKLSCVDADLRRKRWVWLYDKEAKSLQFKKSYSDFPKKQRPIVLGSFYSDRYDEMHLDVGSIQRATKAIVFFDKHIPRNIAKVTYCSIYNKIVAPNEHPGANFDALFAEVKIEDILAKQKADPEEIKATFEGKRLLDNLLNEKDFQLVETYPINFYDDGIELFETSMRIRQTVVLKRWEGEEDFVLNDAIRRVTSSKTGKI